MPVVMMMMMMMMLVVVMVMTMVLDHIILMTLKMVVKTMAVIVAVVMIKMMVLIVATPVPQQPRFRHGNQSRLQVPIARGHMQWRFAIEVHIVNTFLRWAWASSFRRLHLLRFY